MDRHAASIYMHHMSGSDRDARAARLAEALRENLRRRKAQARSRRDADALPADAVKIEDQVVNADRDDPHE